MSTPNDLRRPQLSLRNRLSSGYLKQVNAVPRGTCASNFRLGIMLHFWLIPVLIVLVFIVALLYLAVRAKGGDGVRREGRIVHDRPTEEDNPPPG